MYWPLSATGSAAEADGRAHVAEDRYGDESSFGGLDSLFESLVRRCSALRQNTLASIRVIGALIAS